ncbi:MAG: radical SAM protein [Chloroflexi bacterium]|nr:radical SAM protein [Chloroflexota bacterium]
MAYYVEDQLAGPAIGPRRPSINEYFLSSYTMAIYDGCEFGCPYCDGWAVRLRPLNEVVRVPVDLPERVTDELGGLDRGDLVGITAFTDPYQPAEQSYRLTRQVLRAFAERGQPVLILTKSPVVLEDLATLERLHSASLAMVMFTLLTTDPHLAEKLEDRAPAPALRLDAIAALKRAGIPVGVAIVPLLPYVNDTDLLINTTLHAVADAGADFVVWDHLLIPDERHRSRINEMLARIGRYPPSYYRDLYHGRTLPDLTYRNERNQALLERCDALNLPVRAPHALYTGRLRPQNEASLLLKHTAFRDSVQGRANLARQGRELADRVYRNEATDIQLRASPLYETLRDILQRATRSGQQKP